MPTIDNNLFTHTFFRAPFLPQPTNFVLILLIANSMNLAQNSQNSQNP